MRDFKCSWWKEALGFAGLFVVNCEGRSGGLMLMWKDPVCVTIHLSSSGHIDSTILHGVKKWRFTGFYGSPESCNRHLSWTLLRRLSFLQEFIEVRWLVGGDFNEICFDREKMGGNPRPLSQTRAFREALDACSLQDLHSDDCLPNRLKDCKEHLKAWAGSRFGTIPRQLLNKRKQLSHLRTHGQWHKSISRIGVLEHEVEELATKEELYWKQRSRVNWLSHGDRNSKYFHACATARRTRNHIMGIVSSQGDWCTDMSGMAEIVENYFANLFNSTNPTADEMNKIQNYVNATIDDQINSVLCAPFSAAEVRKALFDMHPDKAPEPDGMSVLFFQKYWDVIGEETSASILKILNDGASIEDWNATIVTQVPKIQNPMTMKDFRPISLCNICYKIFARSLTNRLSHILNKMVNEFQSAFIPGRLISYNIILGFEALHWIKGRKKGQKGYGALKLDMTKAYDRVKWSFLEGMMIRLGFSPIWMEKIMRCVRTVRYFFSLNGDIIGNVIPSRGLRQEDPLSPYLFVLCAHGLSCALLSLEERRLLTGVRIASSCPAITHLFFANDSLLFFRATMEDCESIKNCLVTYERASGQLINFEKSSLSFSPNTDIQLA